MTTDISSVQSMYLTSPITASSTQQSSGQSGNISQAASVSMSGPGQLWSELQSLAKSDPSEFKAVTAKIASQLTSAESSMSGQQASFVSNLAKSFQEASQTGSMSSLEPPTSQGQNPGGGGSAQSSISAGPGDDSLFQQIQSIISNALSSASSSTTGST